MARMSVQLFIEAAPVLMTYHVHTMTVPSTSHANEHRPRQPDAGDSPRSGKPRSAELEGR